MQNASYQNLIIGFGKAGKTLAGSLAQKDFVRKYLLSRLAAVCIPLLLLGVGCQAAPAEMPIHTEAAAKTDASGEIQLLSMEFRHPVADGTLMRMIWQVDAPVGSVFSAEEIAARGLKPSGFITCLGELVGKEYTNGRYQDITERYVPWTPELEASFHALIADRNLAAANDYGARAENVVNPAYNIVIAYKDGRSLHITSEGQTVNEREAVIEDALLTWADEGFAAGGK